MMHDRSPGPDLAATSSTRATSSRASRGARPWSPPATSPSSLGVPVHLKCENLQRTGSYKLRGAYNRISALSAEERARGVVAASAGNHAQGVAFAARELGIRATIFMPVGVALPKLEATRDYGADVVLQRRLDRRDPRGGGGVRRRDRRGASSRRSTTPTSIAGPGHARARDPRAGPGCRRPSSCRSAAAASPPASRAPSKQQAARDGPPRAHHRRPGRERRPVRRLARGGGAAAGAGRADHRRRHRGVPARRAQLRDHPRHRSTRSSRSPRTTSRAPCSCCSSARSSSSSRPAPSPSPRS